MARLRNLLHNEPHVRGLGYNQYADEAENDQLVPGLTDLEIASVEPQPVESPDAEFQLVANQSDLLPGMDDPKVMKQSLDDEDIESYLHSQQRGA